MNSIDELWEEWLKLIPDLKKTHTESRNYDQIIAKGEDFIVLMYFMYGNNFSAIDHTSCFNKESQCPINVTFPLSKRAYPRLVKALNHLKTKDGIRESKTFEFPVEFEEFDHHVRTDFYQNL